VAVDRVFCNIPWTEVHINADGTYHTCGAQPNRITGTAAATRNNVFTQTIDQWIHGQHQTDARDKKLNGVSEPLCSMCYNEEALGSSSKRIKENHKSGIDPVRFYETFNPSDFTQVKINSYHISLGNECNLACKMCVPWASSKVAANNRRLGTWTGAVKMNWTEDEAAWRMVTDHVCCNQDLKFLHLIGGEPLLNPRFEQLIDLLIQHDRTDIYLGFTTNGTVFNHELLEKLNQFRHVDIGISIECMGILNDYVRQDSHTETVLNNIEEYLKYRKESHVYVTVRTVPSALSVHTLDALYRWCADRGIDVMSNILDRPDYLQIRNLPDDVKQRLLTQYQAWIFSEPLPGAANPRDPNRFREHIDQEIRAVIAALGLEGNSDLTQELYTKLKLWHWDEVPELSKYFTTQHQGITI
jgi:sulfatase maturation enzyme AslB (radical SAM superfamily)